MLTANDLLEQVREEIARGRLSAASAFLDELSLWQLSSAQRSAVSELCDEVAKLRSATAFRGLRGSDWAWSTLGEDGSL